MAMRAAKKVKGSMHGPRCRPLHNPGVPHHTTAESPAVPLPPKQCRKRLTLRLLGAPLLLGMMVWLAGPRAIWAAASQADAGWLAAGLASAFASNIASAFRWRELTRWLGHPLRPGWALAVHFRSVTVNALLPGAVVGGDMFRVWRLRRDGCPLAEASASVVLDRLSGLWVLYALGAIGLLAGATAPEMARLRHLAGWPPAWPAAGLALTLLSAVLLLPLAVLVAWRATGAGRTRLIWLQRPGSLRQYMHQAASSLVVQAFSVASLACAAQAFGIALPWWLIAVTAIPIFLMAALPMSFGGWGTREAATAASWALFGTAAPLAVSASMVFGLYALVLAGLGMVFYPFEGGISATHSALSEPASTL
jgi:uncharacterized membrane protein YbhN (UPF0104 family)